MMRFLPVFFLLLTLNWSTAFGQEPVLKFPDSLKKERLIGVSSGAVSLTATSLIMLNELWYKNYPRTSFQTFNDWGEWEGVDKVGHGFTSYYVGVIGYNALKWSGVSKNKALAFGATWGLAYLTGMEILDGHSAQWGFSWGDMTANSFGTALLVGQELAWSEQRIVPKFSFSATQYPNIRSEIMGKTYQQQIMKDYNGQTYWLSANIVSFIPNKSTKFPKWVSVSVGYGANGMIGGHENPKFDKEGNLYPVLDRYSQYYVSLDLDLHRIHTKSKILNCVLTGLSFLKFPMPTIELNKNEVVFHPIFF